MNIRQTVVEMPEYIKQIKNLMEQSACRAFIDYIALNPLSGDLIQGTNGARKIRWASVSGKGKSGGARIIYFYHSTKMPIFLLTAYGKGTKANLTLAEKMALKSFLKVLYNIILQRY